MALAAGASFGIGAALADEAAAADVLVGDIAAGEARYNQNCVNCHGREGAGMASFPAVSGFDAEYISGRLVSYREREMVGPNSAIMFSLSRDLSDDDIANLAAYISDSFQ